MAAPAALQSAAVGAQVPQEPAVPVRARLVLVRQPVLAELLLRSAVLLQRPVPADPLLAERPVLAHWVRAVPVEPLLSRQSFSAAMAGSTPSTRSNVRAGTEIKVTTERPSVNLTLTELDAGSWVIFELPGFTTAASGTEQSSLDALRKASDTSYFKGNGCALGQGGLHRRRCWRPPWRRPWSGNSLQVSR